MRPRFSSFLGSFSPFVLVGLAAFATGCSFVLDFDAVTKEAPSVQAGPIPCANRMPVPTFCDDFDIGMLSDKWTDFEKVHGDFQVNGLVYNTPPYSLLSKVDDISTLAPADQFVRSVVKTSFPVFTGRKAKLTMAFDVYIDTVDPKEGARITAFSLLYGSTAAFYQLTLNLASAGATASFIVTEYTFPSMFSTTHGVSAIPRARWTNVRVELTINDPGGMGNDIAVFLADVRQNSPTDQLKAPLIADVPRMELGIGYMNPAQGTGAWILRYDNFVANWAPF
jgi:hypothetical protein